MAATGIEPALTVAAVRPDASGLPFILSLNILAKLIRVNNFALAGYSWPRMELNHVIPFAALSPAMLAHRVGVVIQTNTCHNVRAAGFEPASSPPLTG